LARKYTWESVLKYDDEYRIMQYTYYMCYDNSHIHEEVTLIPRYMQAATSNGTVRRGQFGSTNQSVEPKFTYPFFPHK